ncbi:MAG TPA: hypothetical protein VGL81_29775 [Polyangiaceae bacterium]|jgi:hypothetical protein
MTLSNAKHDGVVVPPAVDAPRDRRPGVPMEVNPPHPLGAPHWKEPDRQPDPGFILKRAGLERLTPVFGESAPPRGLSGMMRRAAYKIPEHYTTHWLALLLADRVDAVEHGGPRQILSILLPLAAVGGVAAALFSAGRRRR